MDRSLQHIPRRLLSIFCSNAVTYTASITQTAHPLLESLFLGVGVTCFIKPFCYGGKSVFEVGQSCLISATPCTVAY